MVKLPVIALAAALSGAASADVANPMLKVARAPHAILDADKDGDGAISRAEFFAMNLARFDQMDADHDGRLSMAERTAPGGTPHPSPADLDGDGCVSKAEFFFNLGAIFTHFDANGDGRIAGDEIAPAPAPAQPAQ